MSCAGAAAGVKGPAMDDLALGVLVARVGQTVTHVAFPQTRRVVSVRFSFFSVQLVAMLAMAAMIAMRVGKAPSP